MRRKLDLRLDPAVMHGAPERQSYLQSSDVQRVGKYLPADTRPPSTILIHGCGRCADFVGYSIGLRLVDADDREKAPASCERCNSQRIDLRAKVALANSRPIRAGTVWCLAHLRKIGSRRRLRCK